MSKDGWTAKMLTAALERHFINFDLRDIKDENPLILYAHFIQRKEKDTLYI